MNLSNSIEFNHSTLSLKEIFYIDPSFNYAGNYQNYVTSTLNSINMIKKSQLNKIVSQKKKLLARLADPQKKLLLLDIDETLIHSDFEWACSNHDAIIHFTSNQVQYSVGIFLRPGVQYFLNLLKDIFDIYVFTASTKEYADAVTKFLDPEQKIFSKKLYREHCFIIQDRFYVKDLSIFQDVVLSNIIIVDNSLYSFMNHLSNGILVNSFYGDKTDQELQRVMNYLIGYLVTANDIRSVNEQFFNFQMILDEISHWDEGQDQKDDNTSTSASNDSVDSTINSN